MKTENRGGKRKNQTGRPRKTVNYDEYFKKKTKAAILKHAKEKGRDVWDVAVGMIYDDSIQDAVRASVLKTIKEAFVTNKTEADVNVTGPSAPGIMLPEISADPSEEKG